MHFRFFFIVVLLVLSINTKCQIINTIAGTGVVANTGDGGPASAAALNYPSGITFDLDGNLYIAMGNSGHRIRKISPVGIITTIVGTGSAGYSGDGGLATNALMKNPQDVAVDTAGNIFIAETQSHVIRRVDAVTGIITTVAGIGVDGFNGDGGPASVAQLSNPNALCFDKFGNMFIGDHGNYRVRKVTPAGIISTFAGNGNPFFFSDYGLADTSAISGAYGLCADDTGNLYIADGYARVRKVNMSGIISTFAGTTNGSSGDEGPATSAQIVPIRVKFDQAHKLYIAESAGFNKVRVVDASGIIHTVAGNGASTFSGDGGPATAASVYYAAGIAIDACGSLYISDLNARRIRKVTYPPILTTPTITLNSSISSAPPGTSVTINATITNAGSSYIIHWLNKGVEFTTTTVPSVTYTKVVGTDTITARVVSTATYGCYDSTTSSGWVVTASGVGTSPGLSEGEEVLRMWPIPTKDVLHIDDVAVLSSYRIYNIVGLLMGSGELKEGGNVIDVRELPAGMYVVEVSGNNGVRVVRKVIKQ